MRALAACGIARFFFVWVSCVIVTQAQIRPALADPASFSQTVYSVFEKLAAHRDADKYSEALQLMKVAEERATSEGSHKKLSAAIHAFEERLKPENA